MSTLPEDLDMRLPAFFWIVQAERATGIVLTPAGDWCLDGRKYALPADSLESAYRIANSIVREQPHIECSIYDHRGIHVEFVRSNRSP